MTTTFPLDLQAELEIAGTWTSATSLVYQRDGSAPPAVIQRGRPDEMSQQPTPSSATFEVNNRSGQFSPKNPLGPWYGSLGHNTPARLSIPADTNYLRLEAPLARAFVNDDSNLHITGSIELRIQLALTDWQGCILAARWDTGASWVWNLNPDGTLTFTWEDSGAAQHSVTSAVPLPFFRGSGALRVTMDATTGTVTFYTAASIDATYTQLGTAASGSGGSSTSIASSNSPLVVGYSFTVDPSEQLYGRVYEFRMYSGIGGTVAADAVFSAQAGGATSFTDGQGNAWTCSAVSSRDYRHHGEIAELPPTWDVTGADQSVKVTASGIQRRLGQGKDPVQSPMRRAITTRTGTLVPAGYWPMEDAQGATSLGSAIGGPLMQFDGSPTLANDSSFPGSLALPTLGTGRFYARVPAYSGNGSIIVRWLCKPGTAGSSLADVVRVATTGTCQAVTIRWYSTTSLGIVGWQGSTALFDSGSVNFATNLPGGTLQQPLWMSLELRPSGGNINWGLVMIPLGTTTGQQATGSVAGTIGNATGVWIDPSAVLTDWVAGHMSVQSDWESLFDAAIYQPFNGWPGELSANRYSRLCSEEGIACRIIGSPAYSAAMGVQGTDTLQNLLQSCEDADQGQAFDPRQVLALGYRTNASLCNQAARVTVDYSQAQLGGNSGGGDTGLRPTYDDQRLRNDWTVTQGSPGGGSSGTGMTYQYQLDDGSASSVSVAGDYSDSLTANVENASQVPNLAGWKTGLGTVNDYRWPAIPFNLRRPAVQNASLYYPLLSLDIGDYLELLNMPSVVLADPVRQLTWGLTERLGGFHHQLEVNGVPESPYEVILLDDPVYGRVDTDGSTLASPYDPTVSGLSPAAWWKLADASGSGTAADSSGNSHAGTATSVTFGEASTPVYLNTTALFNGTSSGILTSYNPSLSAVTVAGWVSFNGTVPAGTPRCIANSHTDVDSKGFQVRFSSGKPQAYFGNGTSSKNVLAGSALSASGWHHIAATWDGTTITLYVDGVSQGTQALAGPMAAGAASGVSIGYNATYNGDFFGGLLAEWTVFPSALSGAQVTALYAAASGYTSSAATLYAATDAGFPVWTQAAGDVPFDVAIAGERVTVTAVSGSSSPQSFTVTRSVNGVVKAQPAGADVRLWFPPILALA